MVYGPTPHLRPPRGAASALSPRALGSPLRATTRGPTAGLSAEPPPAGAGRRDAVRRRETELSTLSTIPTETDGPRAPRPSSARTHPRIKGGFICKGVVTSPAGGRRRHSDSLALQSSPTCALRLCLPPESAAYSPAVTQRAM